MYSTKRKTSLAVALGLAILTLGVGPPSRAVPGPEAPTGPRQEVPGQRDGVLLYVGTEIRAGEDVPADDQISVTVGGQALKFRRLRVGETVRPGQMLGRIDDRLARLDVAIAKKRVEAAEADLAASLKLRDEAKARADRMAKLRQAAAISEEEIRSAQLTLERYDLEAQGKRSALDVAGLEVRRCETILEMHEIRCGIGGVIKTIYKNTGEAVKNYEPVVLIEGAK